MKNSIVIIIFLIILSSKDLLFSQSYNTYVENSANLSCKVIKPLSVNPTFQGDFITWPSIIIGTTFETKFMDYDNGDVCSMFKYSGEPGSQIEISIITQTLIENNSVEISLRWKGSDKTPGYGVVAGILNFPNSTESVTLNSNGEYFLYIMYDWVRAYEHATVGVKTFTQTITAQYYGI